ncbi:hypothetical protein AAFF_G00068760 [Aldrovandia affinis]|uniref:VWFC domain-containing protein n=1 Tax=Aldrovandia affinis TaxID=143900 RepID=A0AAD7RYX9_9TELE|nr:hypothetical protein AAFF_G00068760 [Aldrovandia affinis]
MKKERFHYGNSFDQVVDIMGVAQPIRFNRQTCVDIKDNVVNEGHYFTPKGDDPCLSCTCQDGEPEMCVASLCERAQGCQHFRNNPKECCKFTCLDPVSSLTPWLVGYI